MSDSSREYLLQLSRKIIKPLTQLQKPSITKLNLNTKATPSNFTFSLNFDQVIPKSDRSKLETWTGRPSRLIKPNPDIENKPTSSRPKMRILTNPFTIHQTPREENRYKERYISSMTDTIFEKNTSMYPTLAAIDDMKENLGKSVYERDGQGDTFVNSQVDFLNINPESVVAKYINTCREPNISLKRKRNKSSLEELAQRLGDLKSTNQPEYAKNHGTMLCCELWGTKRRIEYRQHLRTITNMPKLSDRSHKEKQSSLLNTSIDPAGVLAGNEGSSNSNSERPTRNNLGTRRNRHIRGKSAIDLKMKQIPSKPNITQRKNDENEEGKSDTFRKRLARMKKNKSIVDFKVNKEGVNASANVYSKLLMKNLSSRVSS